MSQSNYTKRLTCPELEEILYAEQKVLDHGFIRVVDYMGSDASIVQAARVSYGKGTKKVSQDKGLINYLMKHRHTTPFEMCELTLHIKLPIFIARQLLRHRTANVNEYSARYSVMSRDFYVPTQHNIADQSLVNKQCRQNTLPDKQAKEVINIINQDAKNCYQHYLELINEDEQGNQLKQDRIGIARELARMNLPVNFYTQLYWKIDLHNLLHFLHLRTSQHAQYEIRVYAKKILEIVKKWVPYSYEAFVEHRLESKTFSASQIQVLKKIIQGKRVTQDSSNLSLREWKELCSTIDYTN